MRARVNAHCGSRACESQQVLRDFKCRVRECPLLGIDMDYILDSLLISSYLLLPSTFNLQPYFKLNINRILSKGYFYSVFIVSGKYEFKMGLEIEGCSSSKSPSCVSERLREASRSQGISGGFVKTSKNSSPLSHQTRW